MRRIAVVLALAVLPACSVKVRTGPLPADNVPAVFEGAWKGRGTQSDGGHWTIALTLADGRVGEVIGTITYPSLACGGDLILRQADGDRVELLERITFGNCVDGILSITNDRRHAGLGYAWRQVGGTLTAEGELARAQPPAN
jgi:hypothetical protein